MIANYKDTQNQNVTMEDHTDSRAEIAITRITIRGGITGGANECQKCPMGMISHDSAHECKACMAGSEPNEDQSLCVPCKEHMFN